MGNVCGKCDSITQCEKTQLQKLQKCEKVMQVARIAVHASGVACFGYALYASPIYGGEIPAHLATNIVFLSMRQYPGKWKYLTIWDVVLQLGYHSLALVNDFCGSSEIDARKQTKLQKVRDAVFASWAFPIGMYVSSSFWGLYAINRKLVFPIEADEFYPNWLNHCVHTGPIVLLALEVLTTPKSQPDRSVAIKRNVGFTAVYLAWITWVYKQNGVWVYPVLNILNNWQRTLFFGGSFLGAVGCYYVGSKLTRQIWGDGKVQKGNKRK